MRAFIFPGLPRSGSYHALMSQRSEVISRKAERPVRNKSQKAAGSAAPGKRQAMPITAIGWFHGGGDQISRKLFGR